MAAIERVGGGDDTGQVPHRNESDPSVSFALPMATPKSKVGRGFGSRTWRCAERGLTRENIVESFTMAVLGLATFSKTVCGLDERQKRWNLGMPLIYKFGVTFLCLATVASASNNPRVREESFDQSYNMRRPRLPQPPAFNYYKATQQDPLLSRYAEQQKSDFANLQRRGRMMLNNYYNRVVRPQNKPISMSFEESKSEWTPMRPTSFERNKTKLTEELNENTFENDLDAEGSQKIEKKDSVSRADTKGNYVYIHPNILKQNFGLDSKETQSILKNTALNYKDKLQISDLRELIGKNPNVQLEGLKRLLNQKDTLNIKPSPTPFQKQPTQPPVQLQENVKVARAPQSNTLEQLQKQLDEVTKAQAQDVLNKAKHSAIAYVEAQHKAIALAQAKAKEQALALAAQQAAAVATQGQQYHATPTQSAQVYQVIPTVQSQQYQVHNYVNPTQQYQAGSYASSPTQQHYQIPLSQIMEVNKVPAQLHQQVAQSSTPQQYAADHQHIHLIPFPSQSTLATSYSQTGLRPNFQTNQIDQETKDYIGNSQTQVPTVVPSYHYEVAKQAVSIESQEGREDEGKADNQQQLLAVEDKKPSEEVAVQSVLQPQAYQEIIMETKGEKIQNIEEEAEANHDDYAAKYAFGYRILDHHQGNDFGHEEKRNGKSASGHYHVLLPDGRRQKVDYYADNSGYHARVTYEHNAASSREI